MASVGAKSVGPAGWVAVAGILLNGVLYTLQQSISLLPPEWAGVAAGLISVLTLFGIYHAPNHIVPEPAAPPIPPAAPVQPWPEP